jgi:hypothetical protein
LNGKSKQSHIRCQPLFERNIETSFLVNALASTDDPRRFFAFFGAAIPALDAVRLCQRFRTFSQHTRLLHRRGLRHSAREAVKLRVRKQPESQSHMVVVLDKSPNTVD